MTEEFEEYDPADEPEQLNLADLENLDPELVRQLSSLPPEERDILADIVRQAIQDIDFAEWENEMNQCCDGDCHVVVIRPSGQFQIWCGCVGDWVGKSQ